MNRAWIRHWQRARIENSWRRKSNIEFQRDGQRSSISMISSISISIATRLVLITSVEKSTGPRRWHKLNSTRRLQVSKCWVNNSFNNSMVRTCLPRVSKPSTWINCLSLEIRMDHSITICWSRMSNLSPKWALNNSRCLTRSQSSKISIWMRVCHKVHPWPKRRELLVAHSQDQTMKIWMATRLTFQRPEIWCLRRIERCRERHRSSHMTGARLPTCLKMASFLQNWWRSQIQLITIISSWDWRKNSMRNIEVIISATCISICHIIPEETNLEVSSMKMNGMRSLAGLKMSLIGSRRRDRESSEEERRGERSWCQELLCSSRRRRRILRRIHFGKKSSCMRTLIKTRAAQVRKMLSTCTTKPWHKKESKLPVADHRRTWWTWQTPSRRNQKESSSHQLMLTDNQQSCQENPQKNKIQWKNLKVEKTREKRQP